MDRFFEMLASRIAAATGRPPAFVLALSVIIVWAITGPLFRWSDTWQLVINTGTTIVTKLDELIRSVHNARNEFIGIEHLTESDLREILADLEQLGGEGTAKREALRRLLTRR
jgi:low affinity Fe/Cu permease